MVECFRLCVSIDHQVAMTFSSTRCWQDQKILAVGLGLFGGNVSAIRFLAARQARLAVTDKRTPTELKSSLDAISDLSIDHFTLGHHDVRDVDWADAILVSPAIPRDHRLVQAAREQRKPIITELELLLSQTNCRIAAVTGTNGKSTTSALLAHLLSSNGRVVWLGGNIGHSLLGEGDRMSEDDWIVLEVSSFQLAWLPAGMLEPDIAVLTNLAANHLDWHDDFEDYVHSKQRLFTHQRPDQFSIIPKENQDFGLSFGSRVIHPESTLALLPEGWFEDVPLIGDHNRANALQAITAALQTGLDWEHIQPRLRTFAPLADRLQTIAQFDNLTFINDSAATTPESTIQALSSVKGPIHLILGGSDKGSDMLELLNCVCSRCHSCALIGPLGPRLMSQLSELMNSRADTKTPVTDCFESLQRAFAWITMQAQASAANSQTPTGQTVLLSPAAASFPEFLNYKERAHRFIEFVTTFQKHQGA